MNFTKLGLIGAVCATALLGNTVALAADTTSVTVSATVVGTCKFTGPGSVSFTLDPSLGGSVAGTVAQPTFWCTKGTGYTITDNGGGNTSNGSKRMKNGAATPEYIPYSFTYTATGTGAGASSPLTLNIASSVAAADYLNVSAGSYSDTVTLSITP